MKQEINRKENIVGTEVVSDDCSIYQETIKLETEDIKKIIKHTGCPIFSLFLQGQSLLTDLQIRSKINGNTFDLGEYAYQNLDVIRISEPTKMEQAEVSFGVYDD